MTAQVKLWAIQPGPVDKSELVERAARICYNSEMSETAEGRMAFLEKLARRGHLSVFEHARWARIENGNPYRRYWAHRYGMNITSSASNMFVVSLNARNEFMYSGINPVLEPELYIDECILTYAAMTGAEKLAHASATFEIGGISRACSHQLVRHRVNSPSQESQRYVAAVNWKPVIPPTIQADLESLSDFNWLMDKIKWTYKQMCKRGIPKQDARYVLPNATPTRIVVTATYEHWRLFLAQRMPIVAQWEIRKAAANEIARKLAEVEPELFGDLGEQYKPPKKREGANQ